MPLRQTFDHGPFPSRFQSEHRSGNAPDDSTRLVAPPRITARLGKLKRTDPDFAVCWQYQIDFETRRRAGVNAALKRQDEWSDDELPLRVPIGPPLESVREKNERPSAK